jgi:predicted nucleic acid-binding protein
MKPYADSGVLIKLYVRERNSAEAIKALCNYPSIGINSLHELEIANTFRTLEGRGLITPIQRTASEHSLETDILAGRLRRFEPDWSSIFREAHELSRLFSASTLARSLDILHVAAAIATSTDTFITGDKRQYELAALAGLAAQFID